MTKKLIAILTLCLSLLCANGQTPQSQAVVKASVDSIQILIGSQAKYTIQVEASPLSKIQMPMFEPRTYLSGKVEIVEQTAADTIVDKETKTIRHTWAITAFDEGLYPIPAQKVMVDGKALTTEALALKVITLDVDTLHPENFYPPKDVQNNPFMWQEWLPLLWIFIGIQVFVLILYIVLRLLQQRRSLLRKLKPIKKLLPHERAMKAIDVLKSEKSIVETDEKAYYTSLTDIIRQYLEERFEFNAKEMTSSEIVANLYARGEKHMLSELQELFDVADLVKFAKFQTLLDEKDKNLLDAIKYIDDTKKIPTEEEKKEENAIPADELQSRRERIILKVIAALVVAGILALMTYFVYYPIQLII